MATGSLTVVGTGIQLGVHLTAEARAAIESADEVLYLVTEPAAMTLLERLNPRARSLHHLYAHGKNRLDTYEEMVAEILVPVRAGRDVCAAFYGHPGVFVMPSHEAIRRARAEGFPARMLPGISAEDCLFADLGVDPARSGLHSYEATSLLRRRHRLDPTVALVLWQIAVVGNVDTPPRPNYQGLRTLVSYLQEFYSPGHESVVYQASPYPICGPLIQRAPLRDVPGLTLTPLATMYVPPRPEPAVETAT